MVDRIQEIVSELPGVQDVRGLWAEVDERHEAGDTGWCADLGIAVTAAEGAGEWQFRSVFDHVLRLLGTTPGPENTSQALRLVSAAATGGRQVRYMASLLASAHRAEDLAPAYTGSFPDELRACLVQELVLRGVPVASAPGIADWLATPGWTRHPLSRLPIALTEVESGLTLPHYGAGGSSYPIPYGPSQGDAVDGDAVVSAAGAHVPAATEVTTEARAEAIAAAVVNWAEESNGRVEARVFALAEPLPPAAVPAALPTLGLACLAGREPEKPRWGRKPKPPPEVALSVHPRPPDQSFRMLFSAASTGGAYNSGAYGAYGRLAAWRSAAGLSGAPEDAPIAEVAARVRGCLWFTFASDAPWFEQVAWDLALATLSPDHRTLTTLAATDTD